MTEDKKAALRNSLAGKKVSELTPEERTLCDAEFKYSFLLGDSALNTVEKLEDLPNPSNLISTMDFLAIRTL